MHTEYARYVRELIVSTVHVHIIQLHTHVVFNIYMYTCTCRCHLRISIAALKTLKTLDIAKCTMCKL